MVPSWYNAISDVDPPLGPLPILNSNPSNILISVLNCAPPKLRVELPPIDIDGAVSIPPLELILPEADMSPKALTLKLPNEADVASINPLELIFPFILKKPFM